MVCNDGGENEFLGELEDPEDVAPVTRLLNELMAFDCFIGRISSKKDLSYVIQNWMDDIWIW